MPLAATLIIIIIINIISFSSPTLSFIPDLKPFFLQILPTATFSFSSSGLTTDFYGYF